MRRGLFGAGPAIALALALLVPADASAQDSWRLASAAFVIPFQWERRPELDVVRPLQQQLGIQDRMPFACEAGGAGQLVNCVPKGLDSRLPPRIVQETRVKAPMYAAMLAGFRLPLTVSNGVKSHGAKVQVAVYLTDDGEPPAELPPFYVSGRAAEPEPAPRTPMYSRSAPTLFFPVELSAPGGSAQRLEPDLSFGDDTDVDVTCIVDKQGSLSGCLQSQPRGDVEIADQAIKASLAQVRIPATTTYRLSTDGLIVTLRLARH